MTGDVLSTGNLTVDQKKKKNQHNKSYIDAEIKICLGYDSVDMDGKYHVYQSFSCV